MGAASLLALLLVLAPLPATADPIDEIARVLGSQQIDPPPQEVVAGLTPAELESFLLRRDPYARYLSSAEYERFRAGIRRAVGVGVRLSRHRGAWRILPIPGGPAWQAGLRSGARLLRVNGRAVRGRSREWLATELAGRQGSRVLLVVDSDREGQTALSVTRQPFRPPSVSRVVEDGVTLLRLWDFRRRETLGELRRGLVRLQRDGDPPIVDLRHASGGDLFEALDCTSLFLPAGVSVAMIEDNRGRRREFTSLPGVLLPNRRVLLLVGRGTASAAESFALALQHHGAAALVGGPTYGKCLTQTLAPLSNGGAIRFSNGRLLGPDGLPCDGSGLTPDVAMPDGGDHGVKELVAAALRHMGWQSKSGRMDASERVSD